jgi:hypothetical protein
LFLDPGEQLTETTSVFHVQSVPRFDLGTQLPELFFQAAHTVAQPTLLCFDVLYANRDARGVTQTVKSHAQPSDFRPQIVCVGRPAQEQGRQRDEMSGEQVNTGFLGVQNAALWAGHQASFPILLRSAKYL